MNSVRKEIAKNLLFYRKQKGLTQKQLAEKLGVKNSAVSNWEKGLNSIDIDTLHLACEVFGVSMNEMFGAFSNIQNKRQFIDNSQEFNEQEQKHIKKYRSLNENGKNKVDEYMNFIGSQPENVKYKPDFNEIKKHAEEIADELIPPISVKNNINK